MKTYNEFVAEAKEVTEGMMLEYTKIVKDIDVGDPDFKDLIKSNKVKAKKIKSGPNDGYDEIELSGTKKNVDKVLGIMNITEEEMDKDDSEEDESEEDEDTSKKMKKKGKK